MKKKGFTLIELLAVIVILAIIALILTPKISNIIISAKEAAYQRSVESILDSAKYYSVEANFNSDDIDYPIVFTCNGVTCENGYGDKLAFKGETPKSGAVILQNENEVEAVSLCNSNICLSGTKGNFRTVEPGGLACYAGRTWGFDYLDENNENRTHAFTVPCTGTYRIELWGAQGGSMEQPDNLGGLGGYTSGEIILTNDTVIYVTVGGQGSNDVVTDATLTGGYNGGGYGSYNDGRGYMCAGGGGSTDVRLVTGDDFDSLKSRIMVAAGGGGSCNDRDTFVTITASYGGAAGGLVGYDGYADEFDEDETGGGATQTEGGTNSAGAQHSGEFYYGCNSPRPDDDRSGGGGGYYGGACGSSNQGGGGGSSFISGHYGCDAITSTSTDEEITHTSLINHYSGKTFTNGIMIDGKGCNWSTGVASNCGANQPQPNGDNAIGHSGNGYAKITYYGE